MRPGSPSRRALTRFALAVACLFASSLDAAAYSVLAHEAIIDAAWDASILPALRARFHPTDAELKQARAFAYGGSLIHDGGNGAVVPREL